MNKKYPTELTDSQWNHIKDFFPAPKAMGRPREVEFREVINAIVFLVVTGCQWRMLPKDYPIMANCLPLFSEVAKRRYLVSDS